jgi:hypothetical protein
LLENPVEKKECQAKGGYKQSIPDYAFQCHRLSIMQGASAAARSSGTNDPVLCSLQQ